MNTAKNTVVSPNFQLWKLGEITVFSAVELMQVFKKQY